MAEQKVKAKAKVKAKVKLKEVVEELDVMNVGWGTGDLRNAIIEMRTKINEIIEEG